MNAGPPPAPLYDLLDGYFAGHVLLASTRLKLYTKLADGPLTAAALARTCRVASAWMRLLLEANVAIGLLEETADGYLPTGLAAAYLNEQRHGAHTNLLKFAAAEETPAWEHLVDIMRGRADPPDFAARERTRQTPARDYGKALWNLFFDDAQRCADFRGVQRAVEIGHGLACIGLAVLKQSETAQLLVVNWPSYEVPLRKTLTHAGYRARTTFVGGDPIEATPRDARADVALLPGVLTGAPRPRRRALLEAAFATLRPGGRLHLQDFVAREGARRAAALAQLRAAALFGPDELTPLTADGLLDLVHEVGFEHAVALPIPDSPATCVTAHRPA